MKVSGIIIEDFVNYKKPSLFIGFSMCDFKCQKEFGVVCQNATLIQQSQSVDLRTLVQVYKDNPITKAIVFGGLEPFYDPKELLELVQAFREITEDEIVIYSGYNEDEIQETIEVLKKYSNIIVKFGRFCGGKEKNYDEVLGVELSSGQYAKKIS